MAKFIYTAAKEHNTSLGNNKALPKSEDVSYEYILLKRRFRQIIGQLKDTFGYVPSVNEAEHMLWFARNKIGVWRTSMPAEIKDSIRKVFFDDGSLSLNQEAANL